MFKFIIVLAFIFGIPSLAFSQTTKEPSSEATLTFKNPFISSLPKKEVVEEEVPGDIKTLTTEIQTPEIKPPNLVISGLVWNTPKPQAIINEQVVTIGDSINDFKVLNIDSQSIEIEFQGKRFVIPADPKMQSVETAQVNDAIRANDTITEPESYY